jgi:precorrin-6B methylase 2
MVYNKELSEFVTVDQMFVGGGITIESMIHESNFIVEELKKLNAVFLNYCRLNEKVYSKIVEHEINLYN